MGNERIEVTRRVLKAMRHRSGRQPLTERNPEGARQVVVCLDHDTIEYATERVAAVGGRATVVVPHREYLMPLNWNLHLTIDQIDGMTVPEQFHPHSQLGMLVEYFISRGQEDLTFHLRTGYGDIDVTGGEQLTAPI